MRAVLLRCPYCMSGFDPGDAIIRCSRCSASHHRICWDEIHHCSVFACNGSMKIYRSSVPPWVDAAPPLLLILFVIYPAFFMTFQFLWFPAIICCVWSTFRIFDNTSNSIRDTLPIYRCLFSFVLNISGITVSILHLVEQ